MWSSPGSSNPFGGTEMRLPIVVLLTLLCFSITLSQSKPIVEDRGNFGLFDVNDSIRRHKYLEDKNQLLLIGNQHLQLLDLSNFKIIDTRRINLPYSDLRSDYHENDWTISPDGQRMALLGLNEGRIKTKSENKQTAFVIDLLTEKRIASLNHPDRIRAASWSTNGKTLMTMDARHVDLFTRTLNVSFWDGETFEYRQSITVENVTWIYLSNDGERFFAASGKSKNLLGIKYVADSDSFVRIWKTRSGELEKTISVADPKFHFKTRQIEISPDEQFLLMVKKHKSVSSEDRLLVWEINGGINPKYELRPQPEIDDARVEISPDGKYFAVDVGKNLQIYETETGKLKVQLTNIDLPSWGWLDNEILANVDFKPRNLIRAGKVLKAFDATDGHLLYTQRLAYDVLETYDFSYTNDPSPPIILDDTTLRPHPSRRIFLTSSNQFAKIFDSRTGELLQTVVEPPVRVDLMGKPKSTSRYMVSTADWSRDGKALYVLSANHRSVSLWQLVEN
jgi:dipeptidyl aminopeptidase/acylaminoacyl peptidase